MYCSVIICCRSFLLFSSFVFVISTASIIYCGSFLYLSSCWSCSVCCFYLNYHRYESFWLLLACLSFDIGLFSYIHLVVPLGVDRFCCSHFIYCFGVGHFVTSFIFVLFIIWLGYIFFPRKRSSQHHTPVLSTPNRTNPWLLIPNSDASNSITA